MYPDYSIYPQYDFALAMTTRGCPRGCAWCHVAAKEGRRTVQVAEVSDFWRGEKPAIEVMDANILAARNRIKLLNAYAETGAMINYSQGLDIRLVDNEVVEVLNRTRIRLPHFAWDNPKIDLTKHFAYWASKYKRAAKGMVYVLCGFDSTIDEDLHRIYTLRDMGYDPYVMVYNKRDASKTVRRLQRWCNNKWIFKAARWFEDYK